MRNEFPSILNISYGFRKKVIASKMLPSVQRKQLVVSARIITLSSEVQAGSLGKN